ncbi:phosphonoacetaldehyde hydrolase [Billgrantia kenyensis]|uniref:Phosphonoacetaldehyde hydrolase n=1 Tax=Billgrantia kenyensis TaxID=321266 RepID=A0A7W0AE95_9GAMM|nr:phosphonoacetaldehyde hydrolase [Halomonas kenyensis]MBA2779335.1 phosphonoacetaldehyde hydrolase [Halomonas kenyensis]MCG6662517.1 phosphonoacetaldehyde hydrolase [Halomonas kenyensis]
MKYRTPERLEAVILDWAGTVVDFGSFAPTQIFVEAFAELGVALSLEEARGPMGVGKRDHIRMLCDDRLIAARFEEAVGHAPSDEDVTALYERFMPLQIAKIGEHSALIPGALEAIAVLCEQEMKVGSCSGYPAVVMEQVVVRAREQGFEADHVVASDEVPNGRPHPSQALTNVIALGIEDVAACVKVDDTLPGILEGRRAGMWTVGLTCSGNAMGISYEAYRELPEAVLEMKRSSIERHFAPAQPHFLIDTIAELPGVVKEINARLMRGERP